MFIFIVLIGAILIGLARGGSLGNFADLKIAWQPIILLGFLIQVLVFSEAWQANADLKGATPLAYLLSLILLLVALTKNYRVPGMPFILFGFFLNFTAIALNGGHMPASLSALETAGLFSLTPGATNNNSIGMGANTPLWFLCDIFAIPKGFPLPNVFSIGDVLIAIGAVLLIQKVMVQPPK